MNIENPSLSTIAASLTLIRKTYTRLSHADSKKDVRAQLTELYHLANTLAADAGALLTEEPHP